MSRGVPSFLIKWKLGKCVKDSLNTHSQLTGTIDVVEFQPFFVAHVGLHNIKRYGFCIIWIYTEIR